MLVRKLLASTLNLLLSYYKYSIESLINVRGYLETKDRAWHRDLLFICSGTLLVSYCT
jgi:hypothetical protein